jgi:small GTP-binding protein
MTFGTDTADVFVWDTAGQEQFQSLTPLYVRSASAAIIVTAIDAPDSFDAIGSWIQLMENSCDVMPPIILAVNKIDCDAALSTSEIELRYKERFSSALFFVSAKTGEFVDDAFLYAAKVGYDFVVAQSKAKSVPMLEDVDTKHCC